MNMEQEPDQYEEESLHAFVDGQMDVKAHAAFVERTQADKTLMEKVCSLRRVRDAVRAAYAQPPVPARGSRAVRQRAWLRQGIAACLLAGLSAAGGWYGHALTQPAPQEVSALVTYAQQLQKLARYSPDLASSRVVFHVMTSDARATGEMLNDVEFLLKAHKLAGVPLQVDVVANGEGLSLVGSQQTQHAARIHEISQEWQNIRFSACKNTMDRLYKEQGIRFDLLPDVNVIESGVVNAARRQREGWSYIRV
jgi:hypothetical protein